MKSDEDITLAVETKDGMFAMILKPKSWRFDDCYSVCMVTKGKGLTMIHKSVLTTDQITELHNEKHTADFKNMFNISIKSQMKCNVYEIDKPINIVILGDFKDEFEGEED